MPEYLVPSLLWLLALAVLGLLVISLTLVAHLGVRFQELLDIVKNERWK